MKKIKIFSAVICICLLLVACKNTVPQNSSDNDITSSEFSSLVTSVTEVSGQSEQEIPLKPTHAAVPKCINVGKTVTVTGKLENSCYCEKITELQNVLDAYLHNISLSVYAVDGTKGLYYNTNAEIFGACTVKAAYTLYACKQMENGNVSLQTELIYEPKHFESGTGDMQYSPFGTVFTMKTALYKSMSISDNVGYLMSVDYFGRDGYNAFVRDIGCDSLQIKPTVWSLRTKSQDLVKVWCEIYNYFETNTEYARFFKDSCTNTAGNYATAALSGVDYSHKQGHNSTGDWLSLSDAGIVWKGETPYIIAIITDAPGNSVYDADVFARIIKTVHNDLF